MTYQEFKLSPENVLKENYIIMNEVKSKKPKNTNKQVNIVRLSQAIKKNMLREALKNQYQ